MYKQSRGFTLIELMIVVVIVGVLAAFAFPAYQTHMESARRSAAQQFMMTIASKEEQYLLENRSYVVGGTALTSLGLETPPDVSENYGFTIAAVTGVNPSYIITATPRGSMDGTDRLTLNHRGVKTPSDLWE